MIFARIAAREINDNAALRRLKTGPDRATFELRRR
jgi:hypothetical protein